MATAESVSTFGPMLREWRRARGASQLDLALACGVSQRHLSFLETGRSRPGRGTVLHLASVLHVPLDQQNAMLLAAGFAPVYRKRSLDAPEMKLIQQAIAQTLERQEPYPGVLVDDAYTVLRTNRALSRVVGFLLGAEAAATAAAATPMNVAELVLRADGLRPVIENWTEVGTWMLRRLRSEAMLEGNDSDVGRLLERLLRLPEVAGLDRVAPADQALPPALALCFRKGDVRLAVFSIIASLGTPLDVSLQHIRLELFFPADDATAAWFERGA